eukprot:503111_1
MPLVTRTFAGPDAAEDVVFDTNLDGSKVRVGIISARWNVQYVNSLRDGVKQALKNCSVIEENIFETSVPGSYELAMAARFLALSNTVDVIVCLGTLIKGDTTHFEVISDAVSSGLMQVSLSTSVPVVFGVLTCLDEKQAEKRSIGKDNHGIGWGKTAVEMGLLRLSALGESIGKKKLGFEDPEEVKESDKKEPMKKDPAKVGF